MKKITLGLLLLGMSVVGFGQAVADNALIPISITLNSILRMNVTSGGNIDFTVNTLDQYENGIANSPRYQTRFTVASSTDFWVQMYAEDDAFYGSDDVANVMDLDLVAYSLTSDGNNGDAAETVLSPTTGAWQSLTDDTNPISIVSPGTGNAGDISDNNFTVMWELGTTQVATASGGTMPLLKGGNFSSDRYATNVFLVLSATAP